MTTNRRALVLTTVAAVIGSVALLMMPSQIADLQEPPDAEIFYGVLSELDGREIAFEQSKVSVSVIGAQGTDTPRRYRLYVDCSDDGLLLTPLGNPMGVGRRWTSFGGSAGPEFASIVHCPEEDPARYNRVVVVMGAGGDLELASGELRLISTAGSARFAEASRPAH